MSSKKSKVNPKYKTKYRVANWPEYDRALVQRGDLTLWLSPDAIKKWSAKGTPFSRRCCCVESPRHGRFKAVA